MLRLPKEWNGKLVVAGAAGTRSEFNGDLVISDFVLQKGYAYASQNKGMLNWEPSESNAKACPLHPVDSGDNQLLDRVGSSRSHSTGRVGSSRMVDNSRSHNKGSHNRNSHGDKHGDTVVASSRPFQWGYNFSLQATDFLHLALSPHCLLQPADACIQSKLTCFHPTLLNPDVAGDQGECDYRSA